MLVEDGEAMLVIFHLEDAFHSCLFEAEIEAADGTPANKEPKVILSFTGDLLVSHVLDIQYFFIHFPMT